ncbi:MAG: Rne/Rng family ribonuclease [Alkalilacustris sp.]
MPNKMLIDATHAEETRVVVVDGNRVEEFDFEAASRRQLAGNIYLAKVTRVEPSLQAAFVDYGGNRHGFLAFSEIHPDYYQIPVADRKALIEEERAYAEAQEEENARARNRRRARAKPAEDEGEARVEAGPAGMDVVDAAGEDYPDSDPRTGSEGEDNRPYAAVDHAAEIDDQIESIADEDVADEIRAPRRPRPRRYKIQEVIKVRQILLVQVVKEERGNKGAALTTYLSLAGRYCVLMPNTARGGGISRKITNAVDRKKLKEIAATLTVPEGAGLIIRTAGAKRTKAEIKRDYEYLQRLWEQIRDLTLKSIAPAPIYEEGNLIKRTIRDLYSRDIDEVLVEGEHGYRVAKDFMKMIMPSHAKNVRQYTDPLPLFARYQVESYLAGMFNPTVQLKSGGYIVIGITEALVSIDVNSGRATKEGSIEETALKTNLEAAEEIARQLRLRDLAGLIVIDFIDMEERRNNAAVEKKLKDKLKNDRARIQVGRISGFGLLEMSRQRLRPGMLEATTQPCPHCHGTGLIRSDDSVGLAVLRQIEEEGTRGKSAEVLVRAPVGIINFLINQKREHIAQIEGRYGMAVRLEADPAMVSPDFTLEKFKTATRPVQQVAPVVSLDASSMPEPDLDDDLVDDVDEDEEEGASEAAEPRQAPQETAEQAAGEGGGRRKRRRRRRRRGGGGGDAATEAGDTPPEAGPAQGVAETEEDAAGADPESLAAASDSLPEAVAEAVSGDTPQEGAKPAPRKRTRRRRPASDDAAAPEAEAAMAAADAPGPEAAGLESAEAKPPRRRRSRKAPLPAETPASDTAAGAPAVEAPVEAPVDAAVEAGPVEAGSVPVQDAPPAPTEPAASEPAAQQAAPSASESADLSPRAASGATASKADDTDGGGAGEPDPAGSDGASVPVEPAAAEPASEGDARPRPRRRGWWALGR